MIDETQAQCLPGINHRRRKHQFQGLAICDQLGEPLGAAITGSNPDLLPAGQNAPPNCQAGNDKPWPVHNPHPMQSIDCGYHRLRTILDPEKDIAALFR